jgi:hypothetical protein
MAAQKVELRKVELMRQLVHSIAVLAARPAGGFFVVCPTPGDLANVLNFIFRELAIPAEVVGWWDGSDGEHYPCSPEGCGDDEPCKEFEELARSEGVEEFDVWGNRLLVMFYD